MIRVFLIILLLIAGLLQASAQQGMVQGKVLNEKTKQPLSFVNITEKGTSRGTTTDIDGRFSLSVSRKKTQIVFSYIGYERKEVELKAGEKNLQIFLSEEPSELEEIVVLPGTNPAHRIIKNAVHHRDSNNPENLNSFSYKSYSKFVATINTDSVEDKIDTVYHEKYRDSIVKIDSSGNHLIQMMNRQHLFFMETMSERNYIKGKRDNERVLANKTSGFKNPLFALASTELQSFSFYENYISILGADFLNPLTTGSTNRYFFLLEDTAYNSPVDTVFVISFRPKPNYGFRPLQGVLYINSSDWAIQNVIARPVEFEGMRVEVEQKYKRYAEHTWFPYQLNANIGFNTIKVKDGFVEARMRTYLEDVKIGEELNRKDISRALISIDDNAVERAPEILGRYRTDSLTAQERYTYKFMDSISETENLERRMKFIVALLQGRIPIGKVDLIFDKIVNFNEYEGFRLGAGIETNDKLSEWLTLGAYYGYGFKDKISKYGISTDVRLNRLHNLHWFGGYQFDLFESGGTQFIQQPDEGLFSDNYRDLFIRQWDETSRAYSGFTYDPLGTLKMKLLAQREQREMIGTYQFAGHDHENPNPFNFFEVIGSLRYAPDEDFVEGSDFGRLVINEAFPVAYLQYTRGFENVWGANYNYDKIDLRLEHRIKTLRLGVAIFEIQGGTVMQDLPYSKLYVGTANLKNADKLYDRWSSVADRNSFETMFFNEFLSDTYVHIMWRQDFRSLFFRRKNFAPHIEWVGRALWGNLRSPHLHTGIDFKVPDKGFYETGLEFNRLYTENFLNLGLGFYYRLGAYTNPAFVDNFAIKITSKFSL